MSVSSGLTRMPWWCSSSTLTAMMSSFVSGLPPAEAPPGRFATSVPQMPLGRKSTNAMKMSPITSGQRSVKTAQPVSEHEVGAGADEGAEEGARAAEQRHDHHLPRRDPVQRLDRHDGEAERVERARQAGEERGEDEGQVLDAPDVVAARGRAVAVLADGLEHGAEGRVEDALEARRPRGTTSDEGEVVEGQRALEVDLPAEEVERAAAECRAGRRRRPSGRPGGNAMK